MLKQQGVTQAGDVYQIGVVLYEMLVGIPPYYSDNIKMLYQNIEKGNLKMPKYLTTEAKKFLARILTRDPKKRPSLEQLKQDPFFSEINWQRLAKKEVAPPTILSIKKQTNESEEAGGTFIKKQVDELEHLFESQDDVEANEEQSLAAKGKPRVLFDDEDYEEHNKRHNRVRSYSFSIGMPK